MVALKPKTTPITLDLTGHKVRFESPVNFSKAYFKVLKPHYDINLHDQDLYKTTFSNANNCHPIGKSSWDYGKNIFGFIKGTMSMTLTLFQVNNKQLNIDNDEVFLSVLQAGFESEYDDAARKEYAIDLPEQYEIRNIGGTRWGYYEYLSHHHHTRINYSIRITDQHYIKAHFQFYNNGRHDMSVWKPKALAALETMLVSFEVS